MKRSLTMGILQERNPGSRILRKVELKGEKRGKKVRETVNSGGVFR